MATLDLPRLVVRVWLAAEGRPVVEDEQQDPVSGRRRGDRASDEIRQGQWLRRAVSAVRVSLDTHEERRLLLSAVLEVNLILVADLSHRLADEKVKVDVARRMTDADPVLLEEKVALTGSEEENATGRHARTLPAGVPCQSSATLISPPSTREAALPA